MIFCDQSNSAQCEVEKAGTKQQCSHGYFCCGGTLSTEPKTLQIRRLGSTLDSRGCLGQSIFIQTTFLPWEQMERGRNSNEPSFFPRKRQAPPLGRARSTTCLGAFPVCRSHDNGIICLVFRVNSQSGESDFADFKSGAAAGGAREEPFQILSCKTKKRVEF